MRYRVKKDFVLNRTLLLFGESLFLQQSQSEEKIWEVYSFYTRQVVGTVNPTEIDLYLDQEKDPSGRFEKRKGKNTSFKDIPLILFIFLLPLGAMCQQGKDPVQWYSKMVQTEDNIFELHLSAKIDSNWFLYPLNERKRCDLCPVLRLEPNPLWTTIDGPSLYYSGTTVLANRCGSLPDPYCPVERHLDSVVYIQVIKSVAGRNCSIRGKIEYYPTHKDSTGQLKTLMFARSIYSTSEQPITRVTVP